MSSLVNTVPQNLFPSFCITSLHALTLNKDSHPQRCQQIKTITSHRNHQGAQWYHATASPTVAKNQREMRLSHSCTFRAACAEPYILTLKSQEGNMLQWWRHMDSSVTNLPLAMTLNLEGCCQNTEEGQKTVKSNRWRGVKEGEDPTKAKIKECQIFV